MALLAAAVLAGALAPTGGGRFGLQLLNERRAAAHGAFCLDGSREPDPSPTPPNNPTQTSTPDPRPVRCWQGAATTSPSRHRGPRTPPSS